MGVTLKSAHVFGIGVVLGFLQLHLPKNIWCFIPKYQRLLVVVDIVLVDIKVTLIWELLLVRMGFV